MKQSNRKKHRNIIASTMNRSIFAKYFSACALIMVLSFAVLGTAMVIFTINYNTSEKKNLFLENAKSLSDSCTKAISENNAFGLVQACHTSALNLDAKVYIANNSGKVAYIVDRDNVYKATNLTVGKSAMNIINQGRLINDEGTLGGFFRTTYTYAGAPMIDQDGTVVGAVFIAAQSGTMTIIKDIFKIFIICVILILMLAFVAIYFVTSRLVRPLRQMSSAAHSFSKGDFSARIPVGDDDEIGELSVAFNNMASSLASLEDMRSSFVANVSHELKTPMTSIAGFIDGILDGTIPKEKENYYLKIVSDEVKRLSRLVRSFLDIARIEAGELKINPSEFDVMEMIRRVVIGFEQSIDGKALEIRGLEGDAKYIVSSDFDLTYQIVYNIIDNAVKFANKDGYIDINLASKNKKVYISIKNSGMGIPAADLPYVFDRFYKTDKSRSRDRKGYGLGLYIVKSVLNKQNQDIVVKSVEGEYCEFVFTLQEVKK